MNTQLNRILSSLKVDNKELAKRMGVSTSFLSMLMTNRRVPCPESKLEEAEKYIEEIASKVLSKNKSPKGKQAGTNGAEQENPDGLRKQYEEKFGVEVSNRYKNDVEWIRKKLLDK